jgi:hypothetical protein
MRRKEHRRGHRRTIVGLGTAAVVASATAAGIVYKRHRGESH